MDKSDKHMVEQELHQNQKYNVPYKTSLSVLIKHPNKQILIKKY